jgi:hypothetical protein
MLYERSNFESEKFRGYNEADINPLNAKLNRICHLLALLEAHHILHVSRIRVNQISKVRFFIIKPKMKKEKLKQSQYRPGQALRFPGG